MEKTNKINKICAIIDAQGFVKDGEFIPRELSLISHNFKQTLLCETNLKFVDMNIKDRITNLYIANNMLGLSLRSTNQNLYFNGTRDPIQLIYLMYENVRNDVKPYVGIKNPQLIELLKIWDIPYVNLSEYNCPKISSLKRHYGNKVCHFHNRFVPNRAKLKCAEEKCELLWKWLIDYYKYH